MQRSPSALNDGSGDGGGVGGSAVVTADFASVFSTTSNHNRTDCRCQIDCGESGYAPILAFCLFEHATTHVCPEPFYAAIVRMVGQHIGIPNSYECCTDNNIQSTLHD